MPKEFRSSGDSNVNRRSKADARHASRSSLAVYHKFRLFYYFKIVVVTKIILEDLKKFSFTFSISSCSTERTPFTCIGAGKI